MRIAAAILTATVALAGALAVRNHWAGDAPHALYQTEGSVYANTPPVYVGLSVRIARPEWVNPAALVIAGIGLAGATLIARPKNA